MRLFYEVPSEGSVEFNISDEEGRVKILSMLLLEPEVATAPAARFAYGLDMTWLDPTGQVGEALNRPVCRRVFNGPLDLMFVREVFPQRGLENRINLDEPLATQDLPGEGEREQRLNARRAPGDD